MDGRVTRLEEWAKQSDLRMGRVETKLDAIMGALGKLPTREALLGYSIGTVSVLVAIIFGFVTAMGWLETRAARVQAPQPAAVAPAPVIIQVPAYLPPPERPHR